MCCYLVAFIIHLVNARGTFVCTSFLTYFRETLSEINLDLMASNLEKSQLSFLLS